MYLHLINDFKNTCKHIKTRHLKKYCFIVIVFCSSLFFGQEKPNSLPIKDVLTILENRYDVDFSYVEEDIKNLSTLVPNSSLSFLESLNQLSQSLPIQFNVLSDNQVAIILKTKDFALCGIITNSSNEVLSGVQVFSDDQSTQTDVDGRFSLRVSNKNQNISFQLLGYKTKTLPLSYFSRTPCFQTVLEALQQELNEIIITEYLTRGISKERDGSFLINYENFGPLPGLIETDVLQTIQALPGIQSVSERISDINIRGGTNDQNLILWDNIKLYQSGHFFGLISAINPRSTNKAIIYKNGTPSRLGDGVSGTVIIQTDNTINDSFEGSAAINLLNGEIALEIPIFKSSTLRISGRRSFNEIIETPTFDNYFENAFQDSELFRNSNDVTNSEDIFSFHDFNFSWLYHISPKDQLKINGLIINNELEFLETGIFDNEEQSLQSTASQDNLAAGLIYNRIWSDQWKSTIQLYATDFTLDATNVNILQDQRLFQENNVQETSAFISMHYKPNTTLNFNGGYQFIETGITNVQDVNNPIFQSSITEVVRSHASFLEGDFSSKNGKTKLIAGLRGTYYEKLEAFRIEPRLTFNQKFLDDFLFNIQGELKSQVTTQIIDFQNDFLGIESRRWILADGEDIPLVRSNQVSSAVSFNKKGWLINIEGFLKRVNGITIQSQGFQNQLQFREGIGRYDVSGIEFLLSKRLKDFTTTLAYTYATNDYTFDVIPEGIINRFPNNVNIDHTINFNLAYEKGGLQLATGIQWRTGKPSTTIDENIEVVNNIIPFFDPNTVSLEDYFRWDFSALYSFELNDLFKGQAGASVWNITDRENTINRYFTANGSIAEEITEFGLGLTPNLIFRFIF